ncbi:MAG: murB, partial [Candidatus Berkelbacteria bacterium]|nr:murB [Candidatus Berkelbacteria bacterium]
SKLKKIKSKFKPVILSARFQLSQNQKEEITKKLNNYKTQRETNQPLGFTAGSVFRNPIPSELKNITGTGTRGMPDLPKERCAGYLLDQVGVKKMSVGAAEVSGKHANFIVNKGDAKAADIRTLIEEMREKVRQKYAIILEEEIEYIGQW